MKKFPVEPCDYVTKSPTYQLFCKNYQTYTFPKEPIVSDDFKDLFTQMFLEDPARRYSLAKIASHPWVTNKELPTTDELNNEIIRLG